MDDCPQCGGRGGFSEAIEHPTVEYEFSTCIACWGTGKRLNDGDYDELEYLYDTDKDSFHLLSEELWFDYHLEGE